MNAGLADYLAWWGPYVVGLLAVGFSIALKVTSTREGDEPTTDRGWWVLPTLTGLCVVAGTILIGVLAGPPDVRWRFASVFLIGGAAAIAVGVYSRLRADRAMALSADALAGIGAALALMALMRNYFREAPVIYLFVAALGAWLPAAVAGYGSSERTSGSRAFSLGSVAVAAGVAMGALRYPRSGMGSLLAVDMFALALLITMAATLVAGVGSRLRGFSSVAAPTVALAALWWLGPLLGQHLMQEPTAGLCALTGAAAAALAYLLALSASGGESPILSRAESGTLAILTAAACVAASIRWLGAYGVSLAALGALASLPLLAAIADRTLERDRRAQGSPVALAVAAAAAFSAVALARTFLEMASSSGGALDLFQSYTIPGLAIGGTVVLIPGVIAGKQAKNTGAVAAFLRGAAAVVAVSATVIVVAAVWRGSGAAGLVAGIAVGVFYTVLASALWDTDNACIDLAPGIQLFAVTVVPVLMTATLSLTRARKVSVMIWTVAAVAMVVILASAARAIVRRRRSPQDASTG